MLKYRFDSFIFFINIVYLYYKYCYKSLKITDSKIKQTIQIILTFLKLFILLK